MLDATLNHIRTQCLGKNRSLPASCYTDQEFLKLELEKVFRHGWNCIGRVDEILNVGDFFTASIADEPLVAVRSAVDQVSVLANVCQHRAMPIAQGVGNADYFVCPYHAWTYRIDGTLKSAPLMKPKSALKNCRLPQIKSECWRGFVFATLDNSAPALADILEELAPCIDNYQPHAMTHIATFHEVWDCNWKSLIENFMDSYHLSVVHPESLRPLTPTRLCEPLARGRGFTSYIANYAAAAPARVCHANTLNDAEKRQSRLLCIYPALVASVSPDTLVYLSLQPCSVGQVRVKWGISVFEENLPEHEREQRISKWQKINAEDHEILRGLQTGLRSSFYNGGPLAPPRLEGCVSHFHEFLIETLHSDHTEVGGNPAC